MSIISNIIKFWKNGDCQFKKHICFFQMDYGFTNLAFTGDDEGHSTEDDFLAAPNTSTTEASFILEVLGGLCDGQNKKLQVNHLLV